MYSPQNNLIFTNVIIFKDTLIINFNNTTTINNNNNKRRKTKKKKKKITPKSTYPTYTTLYKIQNRRLASIKKKTYTDRN